MQATLIHHDAQASMLLFPHRGIRMSQEAVTYLLLLLMMTATPSQSQSPGPSCGSIDVECLVGRGIIPDSTLNLTEVLWIGPENRGVYVGSPSIFKVGGRCFASHDFFGRTTNNDTVQVFVDNSGSCVGHEWRSAGNVSGMYWANLFTVGDDLFLLGVSAGDHSVTRSIVLSRSPAASNGTIWSNPAVLFPADEKAGVSYHCAPTPSLIASDGRLYRAFERTPAEAAIVVRTKEALSKIGADGVMLADNWETTPYVRLEPSMIPPDWGPVRYGWQEGNAVEGPDGTIYDILRIDGQNEKAYNKAAVLKVGNTGSNFSLQFHKMIDFPSTSSKFVIRRSSSDGLYYSLATDVTPGAVSSGTIGARNHLVLAVSGKDPVSSKWTVCKTLLLDDTGFATPADSARFTGFHYVDWVFDGDDIVYAIRTGYRGANSYHNANRLTTKRLSNFAQACRDGGEGWRQGVELVGAGWCRPTNGYMTAGVGSAGTTRDCAAACRSWSKCHGFAHTNASCAMYPETPTHSGGQRGFSCFKLLP